MTQSTPTLSEAIGAELGGLIALGFSENQAKTIIVSAAITAANESKEIVPGPAPKLKRPTLLDCDGDAWVPVEGSDTLYHSPQNPGFFEPEKTREQIEGLWGPLTEVYA